MAAMSMRKYATAPKLFIAMRNSVSGRYELIAISFRWPTFLANLQVYFPKLLSENLDNRLLLTEKKVKEPKIRSSKYCWLFYLDHWFNPHRFYCHSKKPTTHVLSHIQTDRLNWKNKNTVDTCSEHESSQRRKRLSDLKFGARSGVYK